MCTSIPVQIVAFIDKDNALVRDIRGKTHRTSLAIMRCAKVNDYVICSHGYAQRKLDPKEAKEAIATATKLMNIISLAPSPLEPQQQFAFA